MPGNKVVVFGSTLAEAPRTDADLVLFAVTSAGAPDTSFGRNGRIVVDLGNTPDNPRNVTVQPDGKVVATGYCNVGGVVQPVLIRTTAQGQLDTTFGKEGVATAKVLPGVAESYAVALQGQNYILAGYGRGEDATEKVDLIVYRFLANGTHDTAFGTNGVTRVDIAKEDDRARNVAVLPDGRILAVGSGKRDPVNIDGMVTMLGKDGAVDATVGQGGNPHVGPRRPERLLVRRRGLTRQEVALPGRLQGRGHRWRRQRRRRLRPRSALAAGARLARSRGGADACARPFPRAQGHRLPYEPLRHASTFPCANAPGRRRRRPARPDRVRTRAAPYRRHGADHRDAPRRHGVHLQRGPGVRAPRPRRPGRRGQSGRGDAPIAAQRHLTPWPAR